MLQGTGYGAFPGQTFNPSGDRGGVGYAQLGGPATDQPDYSGSTLEENVSGNNGNDKSSRGQPLVVPQARERSPAASHYDTTSGFSQSPARKRARMLDMGSIRSSDNVGTTMVLEIDDQLPLIRRLTGDEDDEYQNKVKRDLEKVERDEEKVQKDEEEVKRDIEKAIRNRENEIRDLEKAIRNQEKINRDQTMIMKKLKKKMKKLQNILSNPGDPTQTLQRCKDLLKKVTAITD